MVDFINSIVAGAGIALLVTSLLGRDQTLVAVLVGVAVTLAVMAGVVAYQRWRYAVIEQMLQPA
jgi:membrane protein YdbS with pleckstrin-like domain